MSGKEMDIIDSSSSSWFLVSLSICVCSALSLLLLRHLSTATAANKNKAAALPPPPTPRSIPVLSNLAWLRISALLELGPTLTRLAAQHGPVLTFNVGIFPSVFITDRRLVHEALVAKGAAFSDRPPSRGANYVYSSNGHIVSSGRGSLWRLLRRNLTAGILHPSRVRSFAPGRKWAFDLLLANLGAESDSAGVVVLDDSLRRPIFALLVYICFGEKLDEGIIRDIEGVQIELLRIGVSLSIFDLFPRVAKFVLWKKWRAFIATRRRQESILIPLIRARREAKTEEQKQGDHFVASYVDSLLDLELPEEGGRKLDDTEIVSLCSELFNAGTDTTATAVQWIMANLVKYPHIQKKLFEEIEGIVEEGEIREEDLQRMEYLKAVILEALRRHPPAHYLLPHTMSEEATLEGYAIAKGAAVNVTVAEIGRDGKVWKDPLEFRPERFVAGGEGERVDITGSREIKMMPFGVGRRICPGLGLAMLHLEYFVANLVREFEWKGVDGEEVDLSEKLQFTVVMKNSLRARIFPRSKSNRG